MITSFKKQIQYWKTASVAIPILALFALIISDLLENHHSGMHDNIINCILITFACISVGFWTWTVWQMINLSNYLTNVENNYTKIAQELAETKQLLKGDRINVSNRQRGKSKKRPSK